jgi:hypothetical protein
MEKHWWRVAAGLLLIVVGIALTLVQLDLIRIEGEWVSMLILFVGAAIFLSIWFSNTRQWWPLIPGLIMLSWAFSTLLGLFGLADWFVSLVGSLGSALPFLYIFLSNRQANWWALIPGGVFAVVGVATLLGALLGEGWTDVFVLLGIALAFLAVFLANRRHWWALIPAGVLTLVAIGESPVASLGQLLFAGLLILAGVVLVAYSLLRRP